MDQQPLGPEDDPYLAYLIWREEREAAAQAEAPAEDDATPEPGRRSWIRKLAIWHRGGGGDAGP
ncbi:hypothetical protein ACFWN7_05380 [Agromyces sp. NPDC058484]|uniref:hypothetical protein n=1 Tax=Agromyces sp. NPDC058484 TaxID=3346524 RepID=UPI00365D8E7F